MQRDAEEANPPERFGGSVPLWSAEVARGNLGARYAPLAPIDFEERDELPLSGWPFGREALDPFYARAHELCEAGPFEYDPASAEAPPAAVPFVGDGIATGIFRFGLAHVFTGWGCLCIPCST